ncbi:MAG TPA: hypothetical protein VFU16_04305 [Solirubrobacterales bacterium]|nr:hypothetical protein [Solirubrobacterales bacterium]
MKLTKIAIALVAVLAMSAVVASGAMAQPLTSNAGVNSVELEGEDTGNHVFSVDEQNVTCKKATFKSGATAVPANQITVNALYNECTAFGFANATVNMGNCHYVFTTPNKLETDLYTSEVDVNCETNNAANNSIIVKSSVFGSECEVGISQHTGTKHVIIQNTTGNTPKDITMNVTVNAITVNRIKDNGLCPLKGTGEVNNGSYNGNVTVKEANGKDIWVE